MTLSKGVPAKGLSCPRRPVFHAWNAVGFLADGLACRRRTHSELAKTFSGNQTTFVIYISVYAQVSFVNKRFDTVEFIPCFRGHYVFRLKQIQ